MLAREAGNLLSSSMLVQVHLPAASTPEPYSLSLKTGINPSKYVTMGHSQGISQNNKPQTKKILRIITYQI